MLVREAATVHRAHRTHRLPTAPARPARLTPTARAAPPIATLTVPPNTPTVTATWCATPTATVKTTTTHRTEETAGQKSRRSLSHPQKGILP